MNPKLILALKISNDHCHNPRATTSMSAGLPSLTALAPYGLAPRPRDANRASWRCSTWSFSCGTCWGWFCRGTGWSRPGAGFAEVHRAEPARGWFCQGTQGGAGHGLVLPRWLRWSTTFARQQAVRVDKHGSRGETRFAR